MKFKVSTNGHNDVVDITSSVAEIVKNSGKPDGVALVFVAGSTAAITTIEFEDGVIKDLRMVLEKIAPEDYNYQHHQRWGDRNGAAHIKSAMLGPDFLAPITDGQLDLGAW